jgi:hypothetical protein
MMTKDEALKMAIEALDTLMMEKGSIYYQAINACKEALEQPTEPRLVSYAPDGSTCTLNIDGEEVYFNREQPVLKDEKGKPMTYWGGLEQPAQEPVALIKHENGNYSPKHQWQGLTDDEIQSIRIKTFDAVATNYEAYRAIEQALKEKNT